jgi:hypothetical protein
MAPFWCRPEDLVDVFNTSDVREVFEEKAITD